MEYWIFRGTKLRSSNFLAIDYSTNQLLHPDQILALEVRASVALKVPGYTQQGHQVLIIAGCVAPLFACGTKFAVGT